MAITIRPLAPDDTERCVELGVLAFDGQSKDQILERLLDLKPGGVNWQQRKGGQIRHQAQPQRAAEPKDICLVAVNDAGLVVGFATVTADPTTSIGHLHNLAVDPEAHSQGIGRRLIEAANAWMVERGMSVSKIDTLEVNAVGRWLYPSAGFDELVREINYAMPLSPRAQLPPNLAGLEDLVRRLSPPGTAVSWWAEEVGVGVVSSPNATEPWPVASAIKAFMMAALFVEKKQVWDSVPPELQSILDQQQGYDAPLAMWDPKRPEWEAYKVPEGTLEKVIGTLSRFTYRMIVQGMMGTISMGVIGNPAYNTCANIVTLLLGGPAAATAKIHALDPSGGLSNVRVGRYQLTTRTHDNENVASCSAFGRFYKLLVESQMPGLNTDETAELCSHLMRTTLLDGDVAVSCHQKNGGLSVMGEHPAVSSTMGFCRKGGNGKTKGHFVFAVNVNRYAGGSPAGSGDGKPLEDLENLGAASSRLFAMFKETLVRAQPSAKL